MNFVGTSLGLLKPLARALAVLVFSVLAVSAQEVAQPTYTIQVDGMACPFCAYGVEKSLAKISGVEAIETDIDTGILTVTMAADVDPEILGGVVARLGTTVYDGSVAGHLERIRHHLLER